MSGQSLGGVFPAAAAVALTSFSVQPHLLGPASFAFIIAFIVLGFVLFYYMSRNKFFLYHTEGGSWSREANHDVEVDSICYKEIFEKSWTYFLTGYVNYATSLCVFPAITSLGKWSLIDADDAA